MRYATACISVLITVLLLNSSLNARIINIPDDQETIQNGIDAADEGDTVLVQPGFTTLRIFDIAGREVAVLREGYMKSGDYSTLWNGENMPSGIYYCRMEAGAYKQTIKLALVR